MVAGGITKSADLDELENHLHEDFDKLIESGLTESKAFAIATQKIGQPGFLRTEFKKIEPQRKYPNREFILFVSAAVLALATAGKSDVATRFILGILVISYIKSALIKYGILNHTKLVRIRPYALVANFIVSALLAGPSIMIQALMFLVLQLLFESDVRHTRIQDLQATPAPQ